MTYETILALDPSGSFHEGKGTTGWCLYDTKTDQVSKAGSISAKDYETMEAYWGAHMDLIMAHYCNNDKFVLVVEDYLLYASKSSDQINSRMETPQLIGAIKYQCWCVGIRYFLQTASEVKNRWADEILVHKGILIPKGRCYLLPAIGEVVNRHCKDSIRHAKHFATFKNKG